MQLTKNTNSSYNPRYNPTIMLKIILFSFMENGYLSLRNMEKSCKTDIRYMWLLMEKPTFLSLMIRKCLFLLIILPLCTSYVIKWVMLRGSYYLGNTKDVMAGIVEYLFSTKVGIPFWTLGKKDFKRLVRT